MAVDINYCDVVHSVYANVGHYQICSVAAAISKLQLEYFVAAKCTLAELCKPALRNCGYYFEAAKKKKRGGGDSLHNGKMTPVFFL